MLDEQAFLQALLDRPDDDTTRLVYADWLLDQDDPVSKQQSLFLRLECELATLPDDSPDRAALDRRLLEIAQNLPIAWTAAVSKRPLENCPITFRFRCPKRWEQLATTEEGLTVRHCAECDKHVYYCDSIGEAQAHAWRGRCIALDARVARSPNDLRLPLPGADEAELTLGLPMDIVGMPSWPPQPPPPQSAHGGGGYSADAESHRAARLVPHSPGEGSSWRHESSDRLCFPCKVAVRRSYILFSAA
jgi:uncharacterized protein (TIGR02996 family)